MEKRTWLSRSFAVALAALAITSATVAVATTVLPPTFEEMVRRADLVFEGKVVGVHSEWRTVEAKQVIFTLVEFQPLDVLKGATGASVTLQFLGGTIGDVTMEV